MGCGKRSFPAIVRYHSEGDQTAGLIGQTRRDITRVDYKKSFQFFYFAEYEKLCIMDDDLKKQFLLQKLKDLLEDNIQLMPTIICERERPEIIELIRKFCLYANTMVPYLVKYHPKIVSERLDGSMGKMNLGDLYIEVFDN